MKLFMESKTAALIEVSRCTGPGFFNILEKLGKKRLNQHWEHGLRT